MSLRKALFLCRELGQEVPFHFNPVQMTIDKAVATVTPALRAATKGAQAVYVNTHTRTLGLTMLLDHWSSKRDVSEDVAVLQGWMNPTLASINAHAPEPPKVELDWNGAGAFEGFLRSAKAIYSLFEAGG